MTSSKPPQPSYKSYFWNIGTTSFRTRRFNYSIERQLQLLNDFWQSGGNADALWDNATQRRYYDYLRSEGFTSGRDPRPDKAAREKTSGLADLGLIGDSRRLTPAGQELLRISRAADYSPAGILALPADCMLFLTQLLKMSADIDGCTVRPAVVVLMLLAEFGSLTHEEFTYLAPLCISPDTTEAVVAGIRQLREGKTTADDIIAGVLMERDNYQEAYRLLLDGTATEQLICAAGINRKSRAYDKPLFRIYKLLKAAFVGKDYSQVPALHKATAGEPLWRKALFDTGSAARLAADPEAHVRQSAFYCLPDEAALKRQFFRTMHLIKARKTLHDYFDLNRRYLMTTGIFLFADGKVQTDIVPGQFFARCKAALPALAFTADTRLGQLTTLASLFPAIAYTEAELLRDVNTHLGTAMATIGDVRRAVDEKRKERFDKLIDTRFPDDELLRLLQAFDKRDDKYVGDKVTANADAPTIFEYILAIVWYKASGREGNVLRFMKLSLDADLLPVTHAGGGEADIVYEYQARPGTYPAHCLLLEATLADNTNQRRMEMEPVSRHLGNHILATGNKDSYAVFATTALNINVIGDFKNRKSMPYVSTADESKWIDGMKIIPLTTVDLRAIVERSIAYEQLYQRFEEAYRAGDAYRHPRTWYDETVKL